MLPHFIHCAMFTSQGDESGAGIPERSGEFDGSAYLHRVSRQAIDRAREDIGRFLALPGVLEILARSDYTPELAGHDLWYTQGGHGVGFWEGDHCTDDDGEKLTAACRHRGRYLFRQNGWLYVE
jgi:hypothetical protein